MVVEILESVNAQDLKKMINEFIVEKDNEFNKENPEAPNLSFDVDVVVVPGFKSRYVAEDIEQHFIAVIQY